MVIRSLKVNCKVTSRFAHYVITSQVINSADTAKEVSFNVEIPKTAFISDFTMCVPCLVHQAQPTARASPHPQGPQARPSSEGLKSPSGPALGCHHGEQTKASDSMFLA